MMATLQHPYAAPENLRISTSLDKYGDPIEKKQTRSLSVITL